MNGNLNATKFERKRIPAARASPKVETDISKMTKEQIAAEIEQKEKFRHLITDQELEIVRLKFDNVVLVNKLAKESDKRKDPDQMFGKGVDNITDIDLFYNTKTNYVNILQKKLKEKDDALRTFNYHEAIEENLKIKHQYTDLKTDYKALAKKYITIKTDNKTLNKIKKHHDKLFPKAKLMRNLLKIYYETNKLSLKEMALLHLDEEDPLFEEKEEGNTAQRAEDANAEPELDPEELKLANKRLKKTVAKLTEEIKELTKTIDSEKATAAMKVKEAQMSSDSAIEKLRAEHATSFTEMRQNHTTELNELAGKLAKYEANLGQADFQSDRIKKEMESKRMDLERRIQDADRTIVILKTDISSRNDESVNLKERLKKAEIKVTELTKERDDLLQKSVIAFSKKMIARGLAKQSIVNHESVIKLEETPQPQKPEERIPISYTDNNMQTSIFLQIEPVVAEVKHVTPFMDIQNMKGLYIQKKIENDQAQILASQIRSGAMIGIDPKLIVQVESERDNLKAELEDITHKYNEVSAKYGDIVAQYQNAGSKLATIEEAIEGKEKTIAALKEEISKNNKQIQELRATHEEQEKVNNTLKQEIEMLGNQLASKPEGMPTSMSEEFKNQIKVLEAANETLSGKNNTLKEASEAITESNRTLNEKIPSLNENNKNLTDKIVMLTQKVNIIKADKENAEMSSKHMEEKVSRKEIDNQKLDTEMKELMEAVAADKKANQELKEELSKKIEEIAVLSERRIVQSKKEVKIEEVKEKLSKIEIEKSKLEQVVQIKDLNLANTMKEMGSLRTEITSLQTLLTEKKNKYKERLNNLSKDKSKSSGEIGLMQAILREREKEIEHLRLEAVEKSREIRMKNEDIAKGSSKLDEKLAELKEVKAEASTLKRYKIIVEEISKNQGDVVVIRNQNLELKETAAQLKEFNAVTIKENEAYKKRIDETAKYLDAKDKEIERLMVENRDLNMAKYYESGIHKLIGNKAGVDDEVVNEIKNGMERAQKERDAASAELERLQDAMVNQQLMGSEEVVAKRQLEKEKEQLIERTTVLQTEIKNYVEIMREKDNFIGHLSAEHQEVKATASDVDDFRERLRERDTQIIDLIIDTNYKTELIDGLEARQLSYEQLVSDLRHNLELREERLNAFTVITAKKTQDSPELRRYRAKNDIPDSIFNTQDELFRIFRMIDENKLEVDFLKRQLNSGRTDEENPFVKKYKDEIDVLKIEIKLREDGLNKSNYKLEEETARANKLEKQIRELNDRIDAKNTEMIRLQGLNVELTFTNKKLETTNLERKAEYNALKDEVAVKDKEIRGTFDIINGLKLKVHNLEIDKKVMQEKLNNMQIELRGKEQELAMVRDENYELQDSLITGTEEFIEKINAGERTIKDLEHKIEALNKELATSPEERQKADNLMQELQQKETQQAEKIESLEQSLKQLKEKLEAKTKAASQRESELLKQMTEKGKKIAELEAEVKTIITAAKSPEDDAIDKERLQALRDHIDQLVAENTELNNSIGRLSSSEDAVSQELAKSENEKSELKETVDKKKSKTKMLKAIIDEHSKTLENLKEDNSNLEEELRELKDQHSETKSELGRVQQEFLDMEEKFRFSSAMKVEQDLSENNKKFLEMLVSKDKRYAEMLEQKNEEIKKLEKLNEEIKAKNNEITALKAKLAEFKAQHAVFEQKGIESKYKVEKLDSRNQHLVDANTKLEVEVTTLRSQLESKLYKNEEKQRVLKDEMEGLKREKETLESKLKNREAQIKVLSDKQQELDNFVRNAHFSNEGLQGLISVKDAEIQHLNDIVERQKDFELTINSKQKEISAAASKIAELEVQLKKRENNLNLLETENRNLNLKLIDYKNKVVQLEGSLEKANHALDAQQTSINKLTHINEELNKQVRQLLADIENLEISNAEMQLDLANEVSDLQLLMESKVKEFNESYSQRSLRDKEDGNQVDELNAKVDKLESINDDLRKEMADHMEHIRQKEVQNQEMAAKIEENKKHYIQEIEKHNAEVSQLNVHVASLEQKVAKYKALKKEMEKLKAENKEVNDEVENLKNQLEGVITSEHAVGADHQNAVDKKLIEDLKDDLSKLEALNKKLGDDNKSLQEKVTAYFADLSDQEATLKAQNNNVVELEAQIDDIKAATKRKIQELSDTIHELKSKKL